MKLWKSMKTWQKVVSVIILVLLVRACSSASTTKAPVAEAKPVKADPVFVVEQKNKDVLMAIECANPNVKHSGYKIVYRDYTGNSLEGQGWKTYWAIKDKNQTRGREQWQALEDMDAKGYPVADKFMMAAFSLRDKAVDDLEFVFAIAKDRSEAINTRQPMYLNAVTVIAASGIAHTLPCSAITK